MVSTLVRLLFRAWFQALNNIGSLIEWILGPRVLEEITPRKVQSESLTGYSTSGYVVVIYCQERRYRCRYPRWFFLSRTLSTYSVFSKVEGNAPAEVMTACLMERTFPPLVNSLSGSFDQKRAAIEAYLDLVLKQAKSG